jgi:ferrochelatase
MKVAVVLFNLGGPDSLAAVKPFLFNLFSDPAIIRLPQPLRSLLAAFIASRRTPIARAIYAKIGGGSPILKNTQMQARALEAVLGPGFKCFIAMRYWRPFSDEAAQGVRKFAPDQIVLLPLYPQFSTTTTASSLKAWRVAAQKAGLTAPEKTLCCYPEEKGFIDALAASALTAYEQAKSAGSPRVLFSAHGLPEKIVRAGDPYQAQCERTAKVLGAALVKAMNVDNLDWVLCYQSRVGPLKWIGPSTDDEIRRAGKTRTPLVIVPIAFVSEHSETLVELDIEYMHMAQKAGVPFYARAPVVGTAPGFIAGLAGLVQKSLSDERDCISGAGIRICPPEFSGCCQS